MEQATIIYLGSLIVLSFLILILVFKNLNDKTQFKLMEIDDKKEFKLMEFELEKYKVYELSKTQMDQDYEVKLKQIEYDKSIKDRDFMMTVTKEERDYMLKQRELDIKENKNPNQLMDVIEQNKDVQFRIKK